MSDYGDNIKYKWTPESTTLLVSVWTDKQVQKQLEYAQKPQLIWESVARYMTKKGYAVSAKQCRSRMKQVLVCYREAKRSGTRAGVEQYYDSIDKVLKNKKTERNDAGIDTVDSVVGVGVKSPPKDVKTDKNIRMRYNRYSEPVESLVRTEVLSPTWQQLAHEEEYPDSPESNETVLAQPYRAFSPTRDAATNTLNARSQLLARNSRPSMAPDEQPIRENRVVEHCLPNNRFGEMIHQNTVQNVQNQIIQETMQHRQHRNFVENEAMQDEAATTAHAPSELAYRRQTNRNSAFRSNDETAPSKFRTAPSDYRNVVFSNDPPISENMTKMQNELQRTCAMDNRAMPQEPRRGNYGQNFALDYKLYKESSDNGPFHDRNFTRVPTRITRNYSPEIAANLNEAFCQSPKNERNGQNFNDDYERRVLENEVIRGMNATTATNNATFNDDTLSIEFLEGSPSPSPSDNGAVGSKTEHSGNSGNAGRIPDAPVRKKKVEKLEHLMLSAISSQTEVVNKILAAQDAMVSRFLDLDRDRQNRLENRLDHLMNVMHATVMNKSQEKPTDCAAPPSISSEPPVITNLEPPPPPGVIPPKLDLVPPKPCRVPCTTANANVELVNQRTVETRPGVVSPIKQPGAIWTKLGPVSQSPFVKAQHQLGLRIAANGDARTQSSAERRIARELDSRPMDAKTLMFETERFLEMERQIEDRAENAKILAKMGQEVATRRKLFAGRGELNAGIILTAAFLDAERSANRPEAASTYRGRGNDPGGPIRGSAGDRNAKRYSGDDDDDDDDDDEELALLAGQVEKYERLRRFKMQSEMPTNEPCDTSTPAKTSNYRELPTAPPGNVVARENADDPGRVPRQTIQQLAELVMKSARWRDAALDGKINNRFVPTINDGSDVPSRKTGDSNVVARRNNDERPIVPDNGHGRGYYAAEIAQLESKGKALSWLQDRYCYDLADQIPSDNVDVPNRPENLMYDGPILSTVPLGPHPIGFTTENLTEKLRQRNDNQPRDGNRNIPLSNNYGRRSVVFADVERPATMMEKTGQLTMPRQRRQAPQPPQQRYYQQQSNNNYGRQYSTLPATQKNMIDRYVQENRGIVAINQQGQKNSDDDDDDEFMDTTMSMQQPSRKTSLTSGSTSSGKGTNCVIS